MSRIPEILTILKQTYPHAKIVLNYGNNWELLVSVILSAQCTDKKVNEVTAKLFKKYPALNDYINVNPVEFEQDIRQTGFYRNKAKNILGAAKMLKGKFNGKLPRTMEEMLTIPGVARKTANVVLGNAYGIVKGIAVDTHVLRLSQRLRLVDPERVGPGNKPIQFERGSLREAKRRGNLILDYYKDANPEKIEKALMKIIPKEDWFTLTYLLIDLGRALCKAQKPICKDCPLKELCPASRA